MTNDDHGVDWGDVDEMADTANDYLRSVTGLAAIRALKRRSHRLLRPTPGDRVLDAGCGLGDDVAALAEHVDPTGTAVGIDKSASLIADASAQHGSQPGMSFQVGDVLQLPFADDTFDGCRADRVFQHLATPEAALAELCRVTRPGGRLTVTDPDWATFVIQVPGLDAAVTQAVTDEAWAGSRTPTIGRRLYRLFRDADLTDIEVDADTVVFTELETAAQVLSIEERLSRIQEADAISQPRIDQWLADLRRADSEETLFCSMTGYTVAGSVPAQDGLNRPPGDT